MKCKFCESEHVQKSGSHNGKQRYRCMECKKCFDEGIYEPQKYIYHFNVKLKEKDSNKLSRDNYCTKTNNICSEEKRFIRRIHNEKRYITNDPKGMFDKLYGLYLNIPNEIYADMEHYTDKYVDAHYNDCMYNFDLNMKFFDKLDSDVFNKKLDKLVKKYNLVEIKDLDSLNASGVYIMVLDEYKQVYIGISQDIKKRIIKHWSTKKEFDRLIFGSKDKSVLSIDSFGALDTTRIFVKEVKGIQSLDKMEEKIVDSFDKDYSLNRIRGGLNSDMPDIVRTVEVISSAKERNLQ